MPGSEPLVFRYRRVTWEDWAPACIQIAVVPILIVVPLLTGFSSRPWFLGVIAGAIFIATRTSLTSVRVCLSARHAAVEISDSQLRLTDWRGRLHELSWNEVSLNQTPAKCKSSRAARR